MDKLNGNFENLINDKLNIEQLAQTIAALRQFNCSSADIYDSAKFLMEQIQAGLRAVNYYSTWDAKTNRYTHQLKDLSWSRILQKDWDFSRKTERERFIDQMKEQYGFSDDEIEIMEKLRKKIQERYPKLPPEKLDWYFSRLLGGFVYGNPEGSNFLKDLGNNIAWESTAGNPYVDVEYLTLDGQLVPLTEEFYFTKVLGIPEEEYKLLRYKVRIQNFIVGRPIDYSWDQIKESKKFNLIKENFEKATGRKLNMEEFEKKWKEQYDAMKHCGDFAHQMIIVATLTHENPLPFLADIVTLGETDDNAGWLGDATNDKDGPLSMGPDDYKADLDAVNIHHVMKTKKISYIEASNQYYRDLDAKYTRAEMFRKIKSLEEVKKAILTKLKVDTMEEVRKIAPDTYNFYRSLKDGKNEMGDYR